jgi:hypothetical protein
MEHIDRSPGVKKQRWRDRSSFHTQEMFKLVRERSEGICECKGCGNKAAAVHHLTYVRQGRELISDLQHVCNLCHTVANIHWADAECIDKVGLDPPWTAHQQLLFLFQQPWHEVWRIVGQENEEVLDYIEDAQKRGGAKVGQNKQGKSPTIIGRERPIVGACTSD